MYAVTNFKTKKALKEAVKAWAEYQKLAACGPMTMGAVLACKTSTPPDVECFQPGPYGPDVKDGQHCCEGPHYPVAHKWYATVTVKNGLITKAK